LDINPSNHGTVTGGSLNCGSGGSACHSDFSTATTNPLFATPDAGYMFTGWTGDCAGLARIALTVNQPRLCGATFDLVAPAAPRTMLLWNSAAGDPLGEGQSDVYNTANSVWTVTRTVAGDKVDLHVFGNSAVFRVDWNLEFAAPAGEQLQAGRQYTGATQFASAGVPGMNISTLGESCSGDGRFTVRQLTFGAGQAISSLAIDFELHCG